MNNNDFFTSQLDRLSYQNDLVETNKFLKLFNKEIYNEIDKENILSTNDGFSLVILPLDKLIKKISIERYNIYNLNYKEKLNNFSDIFIYGIRFDKDKIIYSLVKMRSTIKNEYGNSTIGFSLSFVKFNINVLKQFVNLDIESSIKIIENEIDVVMRNDSSVHNSRLSAYFSDTSTFASYLLCEFYIYLLYKERIDNKVNLLDIAKTPPKRLLKRLEEINKEANYVVYDRLNGVINFKEKDKYNTYEKYVLLICFCSNLNINSFVAEIKYHSDALTNWKSYIPFIGKKYWYLRALRADIVINEQNEVVKKIGFGRYYNLNSRIVENQKKMHGDL